MSSTLDIAADIIKGQGFPVLPARDFYNIIGEEIENKDNRSKLARNEIFRFEKRHDFYFKIFVPITTDDDGLKTFKNDMKKMNRSGVPPSLREVCAASELLNKEIDLIFFTGTSSRDVNSFSGTAFAPILTECTKSTTSPLVLLAAMGQGGVLNFAKIGPRINDQLPCRQYMTNVEHTQCLDKRFRNSFVDLADMSLDTDIEDPNIYGLLSKLIYGEDRYKEDVKRMIFDLEKEENNIEIFSRFLKLENYFSREEIQTAEKSLFQSTRRNQLSEAITMHMQEEVADGELFAVASLFNIQTFVRENEWTLYLPLTGNFIKCFNSAIMIQHIHRSYKLVAPGNNSCLCNCPRPKVEGKLSLLKTGSRQLISRVLEQNICCPGTRHGFHGHMKHIPGSKTHWETRVPYEHSFARYIEKALDRLEIEERTLDKVNNGDGDIEQCLSKEVFGDEDHVGDVRAHLGHYSDQTVDTYLQAASNWTNITIYLFTAGGWTRFQPTSSSPLARGQDCRYYTTMMYIREENSFARIVPQIGCNCCLPPPVILKSGVSDGRGNDQIHISIPESQRHKPMVTFLTEEPEQGYFKDEIRVTPEVSPNSEMRQIFQRIDMRNRCLDRSEDIAFSLFRCISKEIFGTEEYFEMILQEIVDEIKNNASLYGTFVRTSTRQRSRDTVSQEELFINFGFRDQRRLDVFKPRSTLEKEESCFLADRIKDGLELEDLELLAAATCFQTPIYVLTASSDSANELNYRLFTSWQCFTQLRRKRKPINFADLRFKSTCEEGKYFIALYRSFTGQFHRICPLSEVCNCMQSPPLVPDLVNEDLSDKSVEGVNFIKISRDVENSFTLCGWALNQWMRNALALENLCLEMIDAIEKRRQNVNKAVITGASVGLLGSALVAGGIIAAPFTFGASLGLTITGGIIGGMGGITAAGSKITEAVITATTIQQLDIYQKNFRERTCILQNRIKSLKDSMENLKEFGETRNLDELYVDDASYFPGLLRAVKGFTVIPLCVLRAASRGAAIAAYVLLPLSILLDVGVLLISVHNLVQGSKTTVSEDLRKTVSLLRSTRTQLQVWAFGSIQDVQRQS